MPYINKKLRKKAALEPETAGELNYAITIRLIEFLEAVDEVEIAKYLEMLEKQVFWLCTSYLDRHGMSYTHANEVIGVLECARREMERRCTADRIEDPFNHPNWAVDQAGFALMYVTDDIYEILAEYEDEKIAENGDVYPKELLNVEA